MGLLPEIIFIHRTFLLSRHFVRHRHFVLVTANRYEFDVVSSDSTRFISANLKFQQSNLKLNGSCHWVIEDERDLLTVMASGFT